MRHRLGRVPLPALAAAVALVVSLGLVGLGLALTGPDDPTTSPGTTATEAWTTPPRQVETTGGRLRGTDVDGVREWRAIPYAAPPVGDLRWAPPAEAPGWSGVRDAASYSPGCVQPADYEYGDAVLEQRVNTSEDCLYLNVTAPTALPGTGTGPLPVIVWLHGGGFFEGTGSAIDPSVLASRGAVVVTVNYRLGLLGFFAHPALDQDVANLGLLDQVAALRWVRGNAAVFGGDQHNVTLMGGSAGAMSVNALMSSPDASGLFDRAIAESAPGDAASLTLDQARARGEAEFPGRTLDQLRALPPTVFLSSTFNVLLGDAPIVDAVLPEPASVAFAEGHEAAVPYLLGTTDAEFTEADFRAAGLDPDRLRDRLGGADHDALQAAYGVGPFAQHALNDVVFTAPAAALAVEHSERAPTYRYRFAADPGGSQHGAEVTYVFGLEDRPGRRELADAMGAYWLEFARTGDPNTGDLPTWPQAHGTAVLLLGSDGPDPLEADPWTDRLTALYAAGPLRLPR